MLVGIIFILALPLNIFVNSAATAATALLCAQNHQQHTSVGLEAIPGTAQQRHSVVQPSDSAVADPASQPHSREAATVSFSCSHAGRCGQTSFSRRPSPKIVGTATATDVSYSHSSSSRQSTGAVARQLSKTAAAGAGTAAAEDSTSSSAGAPTASTSKPFIPQPRPKPKGWWGQLQLGLSDAQLTLPTVRHIVKGVWLVDLLFNLWSLPLQAICLAVLPVFWALPRLLDIQLSVPTAVLGGASGQAALQQSKELMSGFRATYAWPFVALIVAGRVVDAVKQVVLVAMPVRWWQEVMELPILATVGFAVARLMVARLQDLLPIAMYLQRVQILEADSSRLEPAAPGM